MFNNAEMLRRFALRALASVLLGSPLAVADEPSEPPAAGPPAHGWTEDDGFVLSSPDANYRLQFGFTGGYKFEPILLEDDWQNREAFTVLRPNFHGNLYRKWIKYSTTVELASNPPFVLDTFVDIVPCAEVGLRVGQFWTPLSRHEYYGAQEILFADWSVVANYFWTGRDKGAIVFGELLDKKLQYWAGAFGGSPLRQFEILTGNHVVEGRVTYSPLGQIGKTEYPYIVGKGKPEAPFGVSFTAQGYYGKTQTAVENFNPSTFRFDVEPTGDIDRNGMVSADVMVQGPKFALLGEGYLRRTNPLGDVDTYWGWGAWAQASYMVLPQLVDVAVRGNYVDPSRDLDDDTFKSIEGQVSYYIDAPRLIVRGRYGLGEQHSPGKDALGTVELPVGLVGTIHVFTLNLIVSF